MKMLRQCHFIRRKTSNESTPISFSSSSVRLSISSCFSRSSSGGARRNFGFCGENSRCMTGVLTAANWCVTGDARRTNSKTMTQQIRALLHGSVAEFRHGGLQDDPEST
eukprot:1097959_1